MVRGPPQHVFSLLSLLLFLGTPLPSRGVAPSSYDNLCKLSVCHCPRAYANIACYCDNRIQEIVLQADGYDFLPNTVGSISIDRCATVTVSKRSIKHISPLRSVTLTNIALLQLDEEAFYWDTTQNLEIYSHPGIDIVIANSSIPVVPTEAFKGHINSITLKNVNITTIQTLAFANIAKMEKIEISDCNIELISPQAFKKFILNTFIIEGGRIGVLPTLSMNALQITNGLKFDNVHFDSIRSSALKAIEPKIFHLRSCYILQLEGEAFHITTRGPIFIDDNIFHQIARGAFVGIHLDPRSISFSGTEELIFENNTLNKFEENALLFNTSGLRPRIDKIIINKPCACADIKSWSTKLVKFTTNQKNGNFGNLTQCRKGKSNLVLSEYEQKYCITHPSRVYLVVTILIGILLFLICTCSIGFWLFRKHSKRYVNVPTNEGHNRLSVLSVTGNHIIVIPESKIYRETELNVMTECVEPIKDYVPPQAINSPI